MPLKLLPHRQAARTIGLALALVLAPTLAISSEASKQVRLAEFMEVIGFDANVHAQIAACKSVMTRALENSTPTPKAADEQLLQALHDIQASLSTLCDDAFPLAEARRLYEEQIAQAMSEGELSETIRFLQSPVGQRQAAARAAGSQAWQADASSRMARSMQEAQARLRRMVGDAMTQFKARTSAKP